ALADQNLRLVAGAVDQDQRGCILRTKVRMVIGFFSFLYGSRGVAHSIPIFGALVVSGLAIAFSSEVDGGSREENASKQESRASIRTEALDRRNVARGILVKAMHAQRPLEADHRALDGLQQ